MILITISWPRFIGLSWTRFHMQDRWFPDIRRTANLIIPPAIKLSYCNLCSSICIHSDACLLTNTATRHSSSIRANRAKRVAEVGGSPIRYNNALLGGGVDGLMVVWWGRRGLSFKGTKNPYFHNMNLLVPSFFCPLCFDEVTWKLQCPFQQVFSHIKTMGVW